MAAASLPPTRLLRGILLMSSAVTVLPIMDGLAKHLSQEYSVAQVVWARYFFHLVAMLPLLSWRFAPRTLWPRRVGVQVFRGALLLGATVLFFASISQMPLANTLALFFVSPLIVTMLASVVLGEPVGWMRWAAVLVGFGGVLVIVRPGAGDFEWASLLAIGAGTVHALYMLTTRKLAGSAPPLVTLGYTALVGAVVMSALVGFVWVPPAPSDFALMVLLGLLAATGHFLLIKAFDHAPAAYLAPVGYFEIVMTTAVGYLAFGDFPDAWTWLGIAIIIGSGLFISIRERRYRAARPGA